jgi:hypothetical protein
LQEGFSAFCQHILQFRLSQGKARYQFLDPGILFFQLLEPLLSLMA